jgi:C4-dicarboxylate-specific signal transduction histidine kinase
LAVVEGLAAVLEGAAPDFSTEYRIPSTAGDGWVRILVEPLRRPEGGAVLTLVDITDRKRAEIEAGRLREDLAHMIRVSTLGELAASLAHELNQPLTAILSNVQAAQMLLDRDAPDLDEIREILGEVVSDDKRAGEVIQGLRALFKKGQREKGPLNLNELVQEVSRLLHNDAALMGVALELDLDPGLPAVEGDRVQLQQVILNLAVNGLDAVRDRPSGERHLAIRSSLHSGRARIEVADSGAGIAAGDRNRVFEPFFTTKAGGMGMGLAIARSIVEAHGGSLSVADTPDPGSTFLAVFPTGISV